MSKHIRPVFAVPEATVVLTVAETGGVFVGVAEKMTDEVNIPNFSQTSTVTALTAVIPFP
jgi:hypothetical protein